MRLLRQPDAVEEALNGSRGTNQAGTTMVVSVDTLERIRKEAFDSAKPSIDAHIAGQPAPPKAR